MKNLRTHFTVSAAGAFLLLLPCVSAAVPSQNDVPSAQRSRSAVTHDPTASNIASSTVVNSIESADPVQPYALTLHTATPRSSQTFAFGTATNPAGVSVLVDSKGLIIGGKPVLPVMGEIHYSRCKRSDWKRELQKMKAGGITVVATYVFWNHHEAEEGVFDWSGNKDLHQFLEVCREINFPVVLRVGPFCHGEVRNGGMPDWLVDGPYKLRSTQEAYLKKVGLLYANIYQQVKDELWKVGGPVIGVQVENECRGPWPYMHALKEMLIKTGFDVPFFTRTGWPKMNGKAVFGEILPLYGDYADGFWDRVLTDMPGSYSDAFLFKSSRLSTVIASETFPDQDDKMERSDLAYPYLTCELGGGMMTSYHRRINIFDRDALALALCKVGSGSNLPGYYMYHGGTNPYCADYSMAEAQNTHFTNSNDMPYMTYDFQSPLGEMGQVNESYHWLRRFHTFLDDFGGVLSGMDVEMPAMAEADLKAGNALRWSVRTDGQRGFVFINNYQRMKDLKDHENVQFSLTQADGKILTFPSRPITIPNGVTCCFPFGLDCDGMVVEYATAQPVALLNGAERTLVLAAVADIPVEIKLAKGVTVQHIMNDEVQPDGSLLFRKLAPGRHCMIDVTLADKSRMHILVLDEASSLEAYKIAGAKNDFLVLSNVVVTMEGSACSLEQWQDGAYRCAVYPTADIKVAGHRMKREADGCFAAFTYHPDKREENAALKMVQIKESQGFRTVQNGARGVAEMPTEADFDKAAEWRLEPFKPMGEVADYFVEIAYAGDVARVYADGQLVQDNFYNGKTMWVRASDLVGHDVRIKVLPAVREYPIYYQWAQRTELDKTGRLLRMDGAKLVHRQTVEMTIQPKRRFSYEGMDGLN